MLKYTKQYRRRRAARRHLSILALDLCGLGFCFKLYFQSVRNVLGSSQITGQQCVTLTKIKRQCVISSVHRIMNHALLALCRVSACVFVPFCKSVALVCVLACLRAMCSCLLACLLACLLTCLLACVLACLLACRACA